ncbi:DNRLRE domain-containing protein [Intrasporangium calvum]|uniref:DNRLRE domain-containing protein n=1 Tax=Intrasporangium calvum TaxID=53358 RepID=UPI0023401BF9|nr:DNRLRE domain-containing protein [Intrasporangium calvum]
MNVLLRFSVSVVASALVATGLVAPPAQASAQALSRPAAVPAGPPPWEPPKPPVNSDLQAGAVPRQGDVAAGKDAPKAKRVKELPAKRSANGKVFELSDGRLEQELSVVPVHYRGKDGQWRDIDTAVKAVSGERGYSFGNRANQFSSFFGTSRDRLVLFREGDAEISLGLADDADPTTMKVRPVVDGNRVTFPDALGQGVDLTYVVTPEGLKEDIVLNEVPETFSWTFDLHTKGLTAVQRADGSITFHRGGADGPAEFLIPRPFMFDGKVDPGSMTGFVTSEKVEQTLSGSGDEQQVTITVDEAWVKDTERVLPIRIDPTITVAPALGEAQNVMILSEAPATNYASSWKLSVGTTGYGKARSLVKFPLDQIPMGTKIEQANLQMYYSQWHTTNDNSVTVEAHRATAAWSESTANWNNASANVGELSANEVRLENGVEDPEGYGTAGPCSVSPCGSTTTASDWTTQAYSGASNGNYVYNKDADTTDRYQWRPRITESGPYRISAYYVKAPGRATDSPFWMYSADPTQVVTVNQYASTASSVWGYLGTKNFNAGTSGSVILGDRANLITNGDVVKFRKEALQTKDANKVDQWHSFSVRHTVQSWLDGRYPNYGFVLKVSDADEGVLGKGGPRYEAAEYAYNGEAANWPKLVVRYGVPGVDLKPVDTIYASGAKLAWNAYVDPTGTSSTGDDLVEYQVHRSTDSTFSPSSSTLVAPVKPGTLSFTDTTAEVTAADDPSEFGGNLYWYQIAAKTRDGRLLPGLIRMVRLPKAGRVTRIYWNSGYDTTISSASPTTNFNLFYSKHWLNIGNSYGSTGTEKRALLKFNTPTDIPAGAQILSAKIKTYQSDSGGNLNAVYRLHELTRDFNETTATWNQAATGVPWTTPGGDFSSTVVDDLTYINSDPARMNWDATSSVKEWLANPASNKGFLLKISNPTTPLDWLSLLSDEASEPLLRPRLVVEYLEATAASTYDAAATPDTVETGSTQTVDVTITNPTGSEWTPAAMDLTYRWKTPDGQDVTTSANQAFTALPETLSPGEAVTVKATVKAPVAGTTSADAIKAFPHVLEWELRDKATGVLLSKKSTGAIPALAQRVTAVTPTSDQIGLEKFYAYSGKATGAGATLTNNLYAGNAVWSYSPISNPGRGLGSFFRLAYNSQDTSDTVSGFGWSMQASSLTRLGAPLDLHPNRNPSTVKLTDGDGTTHTFTVDPNDPNRNNFVSPKGVHLYLQRQNVCDARVTDLQAWVMTRPDRTQFFYDCDGFPTSIVDNNGNTMTFTYEARRSQNKPTKFLKYVTDATGRQVLTLDYYDKGDSYPLVSDTAWTVSTATNLTNPFVIDHVRSVTDHTGRQLTFAYTDKGLLGQITDGAGSSQPKVFGFQYDMTQGNKNAKLVKVVDPRGKGTSLEYYTAPQDPKFKWALKSITDRLGNPTSFAYADPDGAQGQAISATVTDAEGNSAAYDLDGYGRPTKTTNAKSETTQLGWDDQHNVTRLTEANGAVSTWVYDALTGYPTEIKDATAVKNGTAGTTLTYQRGMGGRIADLTGKRSPEGRTWAFTYTGEGDLASVTDPAGTATTTAGDFTTSYTYDGWGQLLTAKDANGNLTRNASFEANGYPREITDALAQKTAFAYDDAGRVLTVTDALGKKTEQTYDVYGRPLVTKVPKDQAAGIYITTPAPTYDPNDNVTVSTAPNGAQSTAVYDAADRVTASTLPKDSDTGPERKSTFTYDKIGNLLTQVEPRGTATAEAGDFTTTYAYDPIYQVTSVTNAAGGKTTYTYNTVGDLVTVVDPRKNATSATDDYTSKFEYDLAHRLTRTIDAAGKASSQTYDRDGLVVSSTDQENRTTTVTLDARGQVSEAKSPFKDEAGTILYRYTRFEYDQVGNRTKVITPRGVATATVADDFIHQTVYDQLNRVKETLTPFDPSDARYKTANKTTYAYDAVGRLKTLSLPPSEGQSVRNDTGYGYWDNGAIKSSTDPWDIITTYDYNALGQQTKRTLTSAGGQSRVMTWDYHPDGKLKARADSGAPVGAHVVLVDDGDTGNVKATGTWATSTAGSGFQGVGYRTHAAGSGTDTFEWTLNIPQDGQYTLYAKYPAVTGASTSATYTVKHASGEAKPTVNQATQAGQWVSLGKYTFADGNAAKVTLAQSAGGVVVADGVKAVRDTTGESDAENRDFVYGYDVNGNLTSVTDRRTGVAVTSYAVAYTQLNQVKTVTESGAGSGTTTFTYNENGAVKSTAHAKSYASYEYDARDLLAKVTNGASASDPAAKTTTYTYSDAGRRLREVKGNGNTVDYGYFLDGSVRSMLEKTSAGVKVAEHAFDYDLNGNRTKDAASVMNADNHGALVATTSVYGFDPLDRVASVTKTGAGAGSESYTHDANGNVIAQSIGGVATSFTYDRNRLLTAATGGSSAAYTYDPFGRLESVTSAGKQIERKVYDGFDHVIEHRKLTEAGSLAKTTYGFDALDRTVSKTTGAGTADAKTTDFAYLGLTEQLLEELNAATDAVEAKYTYSATGERLGQSKKNTSGTWEDSFYGYNAHSDVETLTGADGATRATYGYTAYGSNDAARFTGIDKPSVGEPGGEAYNVYRYNAKRWDAASGEYDMGFRDYNPGLNRFTTRDMYNGALADLNLATDPFNGNRYAFAGGNPINRIELDGHVALPYDGVAGDAGSVSASSSFWDTIVEGSKDAVGVARGFGEGAVDTVSGLWECGSAIVDCGKNVWSFAGAVKDDPSVAWRAMTDDIVDDWNNDNQGEAIGRGAFSVVELVFGLKGVGKLSKASKAGDGASSEASLLSRANVARDAALERLTTVRSADRPATVVGAYNVRTGEVAVGQSSKVLQECAEACAVRMLGGNAADIRFTRAFRPNGVGAPFREIPVCASFCEPAYGRGAFPDPLTRFASDGIG